MRHGTKKLDVDRLDELGFFRFVDGDERARAKSAARERNFAFAEETHRLYHADAEDLAEGGVLDFLGESTPILKRAGVPFAVQFREVKVAARPGRPAGIGRASFDEKGWIDPDGAMVRVETLRIAFAPGLPLEAVTEDTEDGGRYVMTVGNREIEIFDLSRDPDLDSWTAATEQTLAVLNELLAAHGSTERAYGLCGGNDLHIAFVTPAMAVVINEAASEQERLFTVEKR